MKRLAGAALLVFVLLAVPASAKVPTFKIGTTIVPGHSIGGVSVGQTLAQAKNTWGTPDDCFAYRGTTTCSYTLPSEIGPKYVAAFFAKRGKVVAIELDKPEKPNALARVKKMKTAKGIRIGSPIARARARYGIPIDEGGEAGLSRAELKQKKRCTLFYAPENPYTVISSIVVGLCGSTIGLTF